MTSRRACISMAFVLVLCVLASPGCRKRRSNSTTTQGSDIFTTDSFPGGPVQDGNVADDKRAMSVSEEDFSGEFQCTFNGERGTAMVSYRADGSLYFHHYDGNTWTPPISAGALDADLSAGLVGDNIIHAFLNTEDHVSDLARARDGDCLIFWTAVDSDGDGVLIPDGANRCIYATYFDASFHDEPGRNHGFQVFGVRLNSQDQTGELVQTIGVCSDGLVGEATWRNNNNQYKWGDATTSITVWWHQLEDNDLDPPYEDDATYFAWFDLAVAGDEDVPLVASADSRIAIVSFGASDSSTDSEETQVWNRYQTYNNVLFMRVGADDSATGTDLVLGDVRLGRNYLNQTVDNDDDITIQMTSFDLATGARSATVHLHAVTPSATDSIENSAQFLMEDGGFFRGTHLFGSDQGLATLIFPYVQLVADPDGESDFGDAINDGRLSIAEIDEATGTLLAWSHLDSEQPLIFDSVDEGSVDLRLSRNGDYIWYAWLEPLDLGGFPDTGLRVNHYVTTRPDDDGTFTLPAIADSLSGPSTANADTDLTSVDWFAFQAGLTYICGAQSDPDVMNLFFEQSDGLSDVIFSIRLEADLDGTPVSPVVTLATLESFTDGIQFGDISGGAINDEGYNFRATDSGEGGNFIAFYVEDVDPTGGTDFRLFAERTGLGSGVVEIDSGVSFKQVEFPNRLRTILTPRGEEIGRFDPLTGDDDPERAHPTDLVHVFFTETEATETSGTGFALRTRRFRTGDDSGGLGETFVPNAGATFAPPFDLDLPFIDPTTSGDADHIGQGVSGLKVGVWFSELSHIYYQEFNVGSAGDDAIGWSEIDGESNPFLVDDDNDLEVMNTVGLRRFSDTCEVLENAAVFWTKPLGHGGAFSERLQVRVRNGN